MSYLTDKVSDAIKKTKDSAQRMNRINYYVNQIKRLNSQQGDFPFERRPGLGKEMTAMYQALWKEYQGMGWSIEKFEKDMSAILGKNFHAGAIAKHSEEYEAAIKSVDDALEHGAVKSHKNYRTINGRLVYIDPEAEERGAKAQRDGMKKSAQIAVTQIQDAGKRRTERARALMSAQIAQARGQKKTEEVNNAKKTVATNNAQKTQNDGKNKTAAVNYGKASVAVSKYQEDGMKRTVIEEQKRKAKEAEAKSVSERNAHNNAKNQAESSMAGYEEWKKKHAKHSEDISEYYSAIKEVDNYIEHHGILGMKWGIRRYQNPDGSLTELGKKHYGEGTDHRTEKEIEKFRLKKSIALAKGDVEFARKNIDYLSNAELVAFKERISARTNLDDLKQQSRKITDEKLKTWASMAGSVSTFLQNGVSAYNNAAKIVNAVTGKQTMPILKDNNGGDNQKKDGGSTTEVWRNNKLEERTEVKKEDGITKTTKHYYSTKDKEKPKSGGK